ncbi:MAG: prolyl-tRNA synthetase associated domain-containing protein [Lachnospiraceae bacterium]|nr:prolyl-tRNA synthetase associated domain-containing protein [Lachnospiraceae bacterium]
MARYELLEGRPDTNEGRLDKEIRCYDLLDKLGMEYWRTDHPDAEAYTMEACKEIDDVLEATVCKNLFLTNRQHTDFYLLLMPGDKVFKTKELSSQIGSARLSFGSGEEMEEMLDCTPGSSSIMGLMNDKEKKVRLLVDKDVLEAEFFGCHPCINTTSLKLRTEDVFGKYLKEVDHEMTVVTLIGE